MDYVIPHLKLISRCLKNMLIDRFIEFDNKTEKSLYKIKFRGFNSHYRLEVLVAFCIFNLFKEIKRRAYEIGETINCKCIFRYLKKLLYLSLTMQRIIKVKSLLLSRSKAGSWNGSFLSFTTVPSSRLGNESRILKKCILFIPQFTF